MQGPVQINGDNLNNVRYENNTSVNKNKDIWKKKVTELKQTLQGYLIPTVDEIMDKGRLTTVKNSTL